MKSVRTGEQIIQDQFQQQVETGLGGGLKDQKVLLWNKKDHAHLRLDTRQGRNRSMVVMDSVEYSQDRSFGVERKNINVNVVGLIDSIYKVNKERFNAWLHKYPSVSLTSYDLAQIAASHLADLYELNMHDEKTSTWRLLLALGEKHAWEKMASHFGLTQDPRFLKYSDISGAPEHAEKLYYQPCFSAQSNTSAFLDLVPKWLDKEMGNLNVDCLGLAQQEMNSFKEGNKNSHFWVREYPMGEQVLEYPDFVLFINGMPILWVEIKTPQTGIKEAVYDFQTKPHYQGAPLCLACNGVQAILSSNMTGNLETWVSYEGNLSHKSYWGKETNPLHSQQYLVEQLLSQGPKLEFYLTRCGAINESGVYMSARSQQYQALATLKRDLEWIFVCNKVLEKHNKPTLNLGNRLIRQTQRTGKTHTMVRATHLALGGYSDQFRLSLFMVGEVLILGQIYEELTSKNTGLSDASLVIQRVESRRQLNDSLKMEASQQDFSFGKILLANMQKISANDTQTVALPDSHKTLVVLDEGHLSQTGMTAEVRDMIFPDASHLLLTATPKSAMALHYGIAEKWHVLDDFGYGLAKASGMVCPVVYKRYPYSFKDDPKDVARLAEIMEEKIQEKGQHVSKDQLTQALQQVMLDQDEEENAKQSQVSRSLARQVRRTLEKEAIPERLNAIVAELQQYEDGLEKKEDGTRIFRPRALVFDRDTENAISIIEYIQHLNMGKPSQELNVYKGWRFGIDVSSFGKDIKGEERTFQHFNPSVANDSDMKQRLKSIDKDLQVDVLLAVGKYTKGYNNDQLAVVALLRNVAEPSLMNQIYTRPATMREGKPKGVCLDLAFGQGNVYCWKESLKLYDKDVDLGNLLMQDDVEQLVSDVKEGLIKTSQTLNIGLVELSKPHEIIRLLEKMSENDKKSKVRNFILEARNVVGLISKMPDSSIFGALKSPLAGLRITLSNLQHLYPDLVEDQSINPDGTVEAGQTAQYLGDIIRQALEVLKSSSLKTLFEGTEEKTNDSFTLKGFLGVEMGHGFVVEGELGNETEQAIEKVKTRQATSSAVTALEAVVGKSKEGEKVKRAHRAGTVLMEALHRALDRLRDEHSSVKEQQKALSNAYNALDNWMTQEAEQSQGGMLEHLLHDALDLLVAQRADMLGLSDEQAGLGIGGLLEHVMVVAKQNMAQNYKTWFSGLSHEWAEQEPKKLARAWRTQYTPLTLSDFLGETSQREDIHYMKQSDWLHALVKNHPSEQTRNLLGASGDNSLLAELPPLIDQAMGIALEKQQAIFDALAWKKSLNKGGAI